MRNYSHNQDGRGNGPWTDFINWVMKKFTELQFYDSDTVKVRQTTRGVTFHAKPPAPQQPQSAGQIVIYDSTGGTAYTGGTIAIVLTPFTLSGITVVPGTYGLITSENTPISPSGNQIPQIPVPVIGTLYWVPIAAGLVQSSSCASGTTETIYINSTGMI